jgi:glutamate-1-semialdehyde 2,1-aminomutase
LVVVALFLLGLGLAPTAAAAKAVKPAVPCMDPRGCPDLIVAWDTFFREHFIEHRTFTASDCDVVEFGEPLGERVLLRFWSATPNIGAGDLIIGSVFDNPKVFDFSECHGHYYFKEYADYRLWTPSGYEAWRALRARFPDALAQNLLKAHPEIAAQMVTGVKQGFCVIDLITYQFADFEPDARKYDDCVTNQGLSRGWVDAYDPALAGQYIDVTDVRPGDYIFGGRGERRAFLRGVELPQQRTRDARRDSVAHRRFRRDPSGGSLVGRCAPPPGLVPHEGEDYFGTPAMGRSMAKPVAKSPTLSARTTASKAYADRAQRSMPGGVTASVKYFTPYPIAMKRAKGARLWDVDGNEYIDYCLSFGPLILGHGHPRVMKAIRDTLDAAGTTMFGTPHELEAELAERLLRLFRPDGKMRFTLSGTEATLHAVRLARGYRRRPMIGKFEGHFHGAVDEFLVSHTPSAVEVAKGFVPVSGSRGTPDHVLRHTLVLPYNDIEETERRIRERADEIACVILEPVERSYIVPHRDFLRGLREVTEDHDIPLIFDEVMSGFRVAFGGAQHHFGVTPDLTCLGKIIGGGLPCGAFLGRPDILDIADPERGEFFHSSTFAGYPIAMAAGLATLDELQTKGTFDRLLATTKRLMGGIEEAFADAKVTAQVPGLGTVFSILFCRESPRDYRGTLAADPSKRRALDTALLERGVFVKPGKPFYTATAHDAKAIDATIGAFKDIAPKLA